MTMPILAILPCTARKLETALHAHCDHHAAWDATIDYEIYPKTEHCNGAAISTLVLTPAPNEKKDYEI